MGKQDKELVDVYLCECGPIIKEVVDLDTIADNLNELPEVARVQKYGTLCSEEGKAWLEKSLKQGRASRVVIAACTPREHEATFRGVCQRAKVNPYLLAIANIREQCSWVHSDKTASTEKAEQLTRAAIKRSLAQEKLSGREISANPNCLVIGSGVAGLTAAQTLADGGRQVYLVEKAPVVGGRVARLSDVYPDLECASCMIEPLVDDVLHHERVEVLTFSEVEEVLGYLGNFKVSVRQRARHVDPEGCFGCQSCQAVCPVSRPNEFECGLAERKAIYIPFAGALPNVSCIDEESCLHFEDGSCDACVAACPFGNIRLDEKDEIRELEVGTVVIATGAELKTSDAPQSAHELPAVYTSMMLERLINQSGCTNGEIQLRDGRVPESIALLHCADEFGKGPVEPCSKICCMSMIKYGRQLREKLPEAEILSIAWERCVGGKGFREFARATAAEHQIEQLQMEGSDRVEVLEGKDGKALLRITRGGSTLDREVDMVVTAPPLGGAESSQPLAAAMRLETDRHGYFRGVHDRLRSFASRVEGVLVAGSASGPRDVEEAAAHGAAAAGTALSLVVPGRKLQVDPARARVVPELCGGCRTCPSVCPYKAITFDNELRVAEVNDLLCRGCGVCVASCPSAAIVGRHFTDEQIGAEIEALS